MEHSEFQLKISPTDKPVIVDFWAPWCIPCRITKPILEKLAADYAEKVEFLAINVDEARGMLDRFGIRDIPTVLALRNGQVVGRVTGTQNEAEYRAMFESLLHGKEIEPSISTWHRVLRLASGSLLIAIGITTSSFLILAVGGIVAFSGVYDRCPIWTAITRRLL